MDSAQCTVHSVPASRHPFRRLQRPWASIKPLQGDITAHTRDVSAHTRDTSAHTRDIFAHTRDINAHARDITAHTIDTTAHTRDIIAYTRATTVMRQCAYRKCNKLFLVHPPRAVLPRSPSEDTA